MFDYFLLFFTTFDYFLLCFTTFCKKIFGRNQKFDILEFLSYNEDKNERSGSMPRTAAELNTR